MKLDVELRDEKINGLQRELEDLQLGGASEVPVLPGQDHKILPVLYLRYFVLCKT